MWRHDVEREMRKRYRKSSNITAYIPDRKVFIMNEGFFTYGKAKPLMRFDILPPRINKEFPPTVVKQKVEPVIQSKFPQMVLDIECYVNYFLVKFLRLKDKKFINFEKTVDTTLDTKAIKAILKEYEIITFNGNNFDIPILKLALAGASNKELKNACNLIIKENKSYSQLVEQLGIPKIKVDIKHIDLIEVAPSRVSLKIYGGRLHCKIMQDLPIEESARLSEEEMGKISRYCGNDLTVTKTLFMNLLQQIELRRVMSKKYKVDLLSKSDAQIAETVIKAEILKITGKELEKGCEYNNKFHYKAPAFISFTNPNLNEILNIVQTKWFTVHGNGVISMPKELSKVKLKIGDTKYNIGIGGLHSTEKRAFHVANSEYSLWDWDVASYYPSIILICGLYPKQIGKAFLKVYQAIVTERLEAKRAGDKVKAETLKIVVNGSYGKLGSPYSVLYAPDLMIQVTITGQLSLLMLIEMMEKRGIPVVSGNTDGIVIKCPVDKEELMHKVIKQWEKKTGFVMESAKYAGLFSRDINNYIAVKENGDVKCKGCFASAGLAKNPENEICNIAIIEYIKHGTPFETTIRECKDITKFVTIRSVKGGALQDGQYLGKAVRWYHAEGYKGSIQYKTNGNRVAMTDGVKPIMDFRKGFPNDVDYEWYIDRCGKMF